MASSAPFTLGGSLSYPPDTGLPAISEPFSKSGNFTQLVKSVLVLTGAGTKVVDFGSIAAPGALAVLIEVDDDGLADPVNLLFNGSVTPIEVARGGFIAYSNPFPATGVTSLSIVHTTAVCVRVRLFG